MFFDDESQAALDELIGCNLEEVEDFYRDVFDDESDDDAAGPEAQGSQVRNPDRGPPRGRIGLAA